MFASSSFDCAVSFIAQILSFICHNGCNRCGWGIWFAHSCVQNGDVAQIVAEAACKLDECLQETGALAPHPQLCGCKTGGTGMLKQPSACRGQRDTAPTSLDLPRP